MEVLAVIYPVQLRILRLYYNCYQITIIYHFNNFDKEGPGEPDVYILYLKYP
jgi:hypothetical protein